MLFHRCISRRKSPRKPGTARGRRSIPLLELMETRELLASNLTLLVTTSADSGAGSLREMIKAANSDTNDTILFNIPGGAVQTITLNSALPAITAPMTIDGYGKGSSTPNNKATPNTLGPGQGTNASLSVQITAPTGSAFSGLDVKASGTVIRGLSLYGFRSGSIVTESGASNVQVVGNFIGVTALGSAPGNTNSIGVQINAGSTGNQIGSTANADRNLISGNAASGVYLIGASNTVVNNLIGVNKLGNGVVPNGDGVSILSNNNTIGGTLTGAANVLSGNSQYGVFIYSSTTPVTGNQLLGNIIGADASGVIPEPNQRSGIIVNNADSLTISGNFISANNPSKNAMYAGVEIGDPTYGAISNTNIVLTGNRIGGNGFAGVLVQTSTSTTIGGTTVAARNVIAGNVGDGIAIVGSGSGTLVQGNFIGLGNDGLTAQGNTANGIRVSGVSATIGGTANAARNVIAGNKGAGILVNSLGTALIQNNYIGLGVDGATKVGNSQQGVFLQGDNASTVGGSGTGAGNVISGNGTHGVDIFQSSKGDLVQGNYIGLAASGTAAVGNGGAGVLVNGSAKVTVGGTVINAGNVISGNKGVGLVVSASSNTQVAGNQIGIDFTGEVAVPNTTAGVQVDTGSSGTTIGGTTLAAANIISGNAGNGINAAAGSTLILGNRIGTDADGDTAVPNTAAGIYITNNQVTVGGTTAAARNVISGNTLVGINVQKVTTSGVTIQGNYIGINAAGNGALANGNAGIYLFDSTGVTVGGAVAGARNVISGNVASGVGIAGGSGSLVAGNFIGTDPTGTLALPNSGGVSERLTTNLTVGGTVDAARNVISGNTADGIALDGGSGVVILGNDIGLAADGSTALGNGQNGIATSGSQSRLTKSTIGGIAAGAGNVIAGNAQNGILLNQTGADIAVLGNIIGTNSSGKAGIGNKTGITLTNGSGSVSIGTVAAGSGNVISGNSADGVDVTSSTALFLNASIGLAPNGTSKLGNGGYGVLLTSSGNAVGGNSYVSGNTSTGIRITGANNQVSNSFVGVNTAQNAVPNATGIEILGSGNTVQFTVISGNSGDGVLISSASKNTLKGNQIGADLPGNTAVANGLAGVHVNGGSNNAIGVMSINDVDRNIISGNTGGGVLVENATATTIVHDFIGTNRGGTAPLGNGTTAGVLISTGAVNTTIGGTTASAGNVISGDDAFGGNGIQVQGNAKGTLIQGNLIGLQANGTAPLPNNQGIAIQDTAASTTIGGTVAGAGNLISFNTASGINLSGTPTGILMQGNTIGLDKAGNVAGNLKQGINLQGVSGVTIGGSTAGAGNTISGNNGNGILQSGVGLSGTTTIQNNRIGTDAAGTAARGNGMAGVAFVDAIPRSPMTLSGNVISGNSLQGIFITHSKDINISSNTIGLNALGNDALPNGAGGILLAGAEDITIGGGAGGNLISGNTGDGIQVGSGSSFTVISANTIGLLKGAAQAKGNSGNGINITSGGFITTIGGSAAGAANIISGNNQNGVNIDPGTQDTVLLSNNIGLNGAQTAALGNGKDGVLVLGSSVSFSGNLATANNVISGNGANGIEIKGARTSSTVVQGFRIGTNGAGTAKLPNALDGILVSDGASGVTIGGTVMGAGNLVSGNSGNGIRVQATDTLTAGTQIQSNLVGTDLTGFKALGNGLAGIFLDASASPLGLVRTVTIGGSPSARNTISANGQDGIRVSNAAATTIAFNYIGSTLGQAALGNAGDGINITGQSSATTLTSDFIAGSPASAVEFGPNASGLMMTSCATGPGNNIGVTIRGQNVTMGGTSSGQGNTIVTAKTVGLDVEGTARNVIVQGNAFGTPFGSQGNGTDGIFITGGVQNVTIGGSAAGAPNSIVGSGGNGIHLKNVVDPVQIIGNLIGLSLANDAKANALDGILLEASSSALIQGNTISGNGSHGVELVNGSNNNVVTANKIGVLSDGASPLGNKGFGVFVHQGGGAASNQNTIGGTAAGAGNIIGFSPKGVVIGDSLTDASKQNAILGNSIFKCVSGGVLDLIDLGNNGPTYQPSGTAGPNLLEVPPTLTSATVSGSDLTITGTLLGTLKNTTFRIEFFAANGTFGPFNRFLGFITVTTDSNGNVPSFSVTLKGVGVGVTTQVAATATDANGNTSGFGNTINAR